MNGGSIETDYDVICECTGEVCLMRRYERDMLVLSDSEWAGRMLALPSGQIKVVQSFYEADDLPNITERADQSEPSRSFAMVIDDDTLRLLVGAEDGDGSTYGNVEVPVRPGIKRCDVHVFDDGVVVTISACEGEASHDR